MAELIEIELIRVRRMAQQAGDPFLVYLIDMAVLQANSVARARAEPVESLIRVEGTRSGADASVPADRG